MNSNQIRIGIVEDEALIADHLAECIESLGYHVVFIADEAEEALHQLNHQKVDLMLLDINIHGALDGVDLANQINLTHGIPIIYITSNTDSRTIERVKVTKPAGFIIKPYTEKDLETSLAIALFKYHATKSTPDEKVLESDTSFFVDDSFFLKEKHAFIKLRFSEILYAEAMDNYSILFTVHGKHILSQTLKSVEARLVQHNFIRIHRSFLVNIGKIERIDPKHVFIAGKELPLSESHRAELLKRVELF